MNQGAKVAAAMFLYAAVMFGGGMVAYVLAPEGANAKTALIVPAACAAAMVLCAMLSLQIHRAYTLGRIGVGLGLVLPLLFAAVIGFRAVKTGAAVSAYHEAQSAYLAEREAGTLSEGPAARTAFFEAREAPDHDKSYLRNTLWFLALASAGAFALIRAKRPKKEDVGAA